MNNYRSNLFNDGAQLNTDSLSAGFNVLSEKNDLSNSDLNNLIFSNFSAERKSKDNLRKDKGTFSVYKHAHKQKKVEQVQSDSTYKNESYALDTNVFDTPVFEQSQIHKYNNGSFVQALRSSYQKSELITANNFSKEQVEASIFEQVNNSNSHCDIAHEVKNRISSSLFHSKFKIDDESDIVAKQVKVQNTYIDDGKLQHKKKNKQQDNDVDEIISFAEDENEELLEQQAQSKDKKNTKQYSGSTLHLTRSLNDVRVDEIKLVSLDDEEVKKANLNLNESVEDVDRNIPPLPKEDEDELISLKRNKKNNQPNNRPKFSVLEHTVSSVDVSSISTLDSTNELIEGVDVASADVERGVRLLANENINEDDDVDEFFAGNVSTVTSIAVRTGTDNRVYTTVSAQGASSEQEDEDGHINVDSKDLEDYQDKVNTKGDTYTSEYDLTEYGDEPNILTIFPEKEVFTSTLKGFSSDSENHEARLFPLLIHDFASYWFTYGLAILACILCLYKVYQVQETRDLTSRLNEVSLNNSELNREWLSLVATRQNLSEHASIRDYATNHLQMVSPKTEKEMVISVKNK